MSSEQVLLEKIGQLSDAVAKQGSDIGEIKKTVSLIAVQSNRIDNLTGQVSELWAIRKEHDDKISAVERFQASCPRENFKESKEEMRATMKRQWAIIALMATLLVGALLKGAI